MVLVSDYEPAFLMSQEKLDQLTETFHILQSLLQKSYLGHTDIVIKQHIKFGVNVCGERNHCNTHYYLKNTYYLLQAFIFYI